MEITIKKRTKRIPYMIRLPEGLSQRIEKESSKHNISKQKLILAVLEQTLQSKDFILKVR